MEARCSAATVLKCTSSAAAVRGPTPDPNAAASGPAAVVDLRPVTPNEEIGQDLLEARSGHARQGEEPEITGVRLAASVETASPLFGGGLKTARRDAVASRRRRANLGEGFRETDIFSGSDLGPGHVIRGPAIVEESFTTIVVYPGWDAVVDDAGDYVLTRKAQEPEPALPGRNAWR